jgi:3',5'-cyclic AMP phosphodiesterase CpdA
MLIAQLTDLHIGFDRTDPEEMNKRRLDQVLAAIAALNPKPDLVIATGDLVDHGELEEYRRLKAILDDAPFEVLLCMGNHDKRGAFAEVFPDTPSAAGFVQYFRDVAGLRIIVLDTLEPGRHGGEFCDGRAIWLEGQLSQGTNIPTLLALHHPPIATGIPWMTSDPNAKWVQRLETVVKRYPQIKGLICGHVHRPIFRGFAGTTVTVCPPSAPQVALELASLDPDTPDNRPMIIEDRPGFALHMWDGTGFTSHFCFADEANVLARYTEYMKDVLHHIMDADTNAPREQISFIRRILGK